MTANHAPIPAAEYEALQSGRGFVSLTGWTSIALTGANRQTFLNNFCTNDIKRLAPGERCEAFFTNVKGKVLGHGLITCREDELVVNTVPGQAARLIEHFDRYVIREDVQFRDTTFERHYFLLVGSRERICEALLPHLAHSAALNEPFGKLTDFAARLADAAVYASQWFWLPTWFTVLLEVPADASAELRSFLTMNDFVACGTDAFEACRLEAGMPLYGIDFDDSNFPQEIGRDFEAISFTKGCYLGQETVARIDALGHVNQRICGVHFFAHEIPPMGTNLFRAGSNVGRVTSAAFSPRLHGPLALAMVRRESGAIGSQLDSDLGNCEIVSLPIAAT